MANSIVFCGQNRKRSQMPRLGPRDKIQVHKRKFRISPLQGPDPSKEENRLRDNQRKGMPVLRRCIEQKEYRGVEKSSSRIRKRQGTAWLYWWLTRLLLERVTSFCEDRVPPSERGRSKIQFVFSRRGGLRYVDFRDYLKRLHKQSRLGSMHIDRGDLCWSVVDEEESRSSGIGRAAVAVDRGWVHACPSDGIEHARRHLIEPGLCRVLLHRCR